MKTAVIFYSWSGSTRKHAEKRASKEEAQLFEIKDLKRPGTLKAYTAGCFSAMKMKRSPVEQFNIPFQEFDRIVIMAPVWAGHLAPAINNVFDRLPSGREVTVCGISASGSSSCREKVEVLVKDKGCKLVAYEDIRK